MAAWFYFLSFHFLISQSSQQALMSPQSIYVEKKLGKRFVSSFTILWASGLRLNRFMKGVIHIALL
jgi:hypothetical protein